jgi:hypothetical protein
MTVCAGLVLAATCLGACSASVSVGTESKRVTTTTTAPSAEVRRAAAQYVALADEMNAKMVPLKAAAAKLDTVHLDVTAANSLFAEQAKVIREFDTKLNAIPFPTRLQPDVRALSAADEGIAAGLDAMIAASCAETCSVYDRYAPFYAQREAAITRLRADLGLPESGTLRP